ncbi:hypothetical protein ACFYZ3_31220 [Streptomyces sp. NPDC001599]|uniref:hypothetical protein n=1 Tax=Streptomyces sp. NPDC001599 TaxID=3364591 RepID=UPI00369DD011
MTLFDKLTGTRRPCSSITPRPANDVRHALLALNNADNLFNVRNALPADKADLIAECQLSRVGVTLRTRMLLIPEKHQVRHLDERWENRSANNAHGQYGRGNAPAVYRQWESQRSPDGRRHKVEVFRFDTREMTDPLRNAVLGAGWTWRGVLKL